MSLHVVNDKRNAVALCLIIVINSSYNEQFALYVDPVIIFLKHQCLRSNIML